jgi:mutual gliding-motility protein MglA
MATIDHERRLIHLKIAFLGPALAGRSTNLRYIHERSEPASRSPMRSALVDSARGESCLVMGFEVSPTTLGMVRGFRFNFHLFTAPGQQFADAGRLAVMSGADGVVMVVDSQLERLEASLEAYENMAINFTSLGIDPATVPVVFQLNKRDLPTAMPVEELRCLFGFDRAVEAVACQGTGVFETFKSIARELLIALKSGKV